MLAPFLTNPANERSLLRQSPKIKHTIRESVGTIASPAIAFGPSSLTLAPSARLLDRIHICECKDSVDMASRRRFDATLLPIGR